MKVIKIFILSLLVLTTQISFAQIDRKGNGGDAIVCRKSNGDISSVRFYDHYEAREKRKMTLDLGGPNLNYSEKVDLLLNRLRRINPHRAELYRGWWSTFLRETSFLKGVELIDIPDTGGGFIPKGCKLEQLAVQQDVKLPGDQRYTINQDFWDKMTPDDRAGLIFHELILREATSPQVGQRDSVNTRYLNSMISTKDFEKIRLKDYFALIELVDFKTADAQGGFTVCVSCQAYQFYDDNTLQSAGSAEREFEYIWKGQALKVKTEPSSNIQFYPNGLVQSSFNVLNPTIQIPFVGQMIDAHNMRGEYLPSLALYDNGTVREIRHSKIQINLPRFKGPVTGLAFDSKGALQYIDPTYSEDIKEMASLELYGRWYYTEGARTYFDSALSPIFASQNLYLYDGVNVLKCATAGFDTNHVLTRCSGSSEGKWKGADGRVWTVRSEGRQGDIILAPAGNLQSFFTTDVVHDGPITSMSDNKNIELWPSGRIKALKESFTSGVFDYASVQLNGSTYQVGSVALNEVGQVSVLGNFLCFQNGPSPRFQTRQNTITVLCGAKAEFYPDGNLQKAELGETQVLASKSGPKNYPMYSILTWDADGYVIKEE